MNEYYIKVYRSGRYYNYLVEALTVGHAINNFTIFRNRDHSIIGNKYRKAECEIGTIVSIVQNKKIKRRDING